MADDRTKISELPVAQSIADTDVLVAVADDVTSKAYVSLLRTAFVGAETTAREAADTALGARIDGKQDTLTFDDVPTDGSNNPVKSNGIYDALAAKANTEDLASVATSGSYNDLSDTPTLATVATTGDYDDLTDKPTIPVIVANPSGEATAEMQKLQIDSTIYKFATQKAYGEITDVDIASFSDGADDEPLAKLEVGIEAVQDLHGYDAPWPAGGGKNKFNIDTLLANTGLDETTGEEITQNSTKVSDWIKVSPSTTYFWNGTSTRLYLYQSDKTFIERGALVSNASFTTDANTGYIRLQAANNSWNTSNLQLEVGSTGTSFAPYSNICPISGWDAVNVTRTGKNLLGGIKFANNGQAYLPTGEIDTDNKTFKFTAGAGTEASKSFTTGIKFKENTQYTFILTTFKTSGNGTNTRIYYTDGTYDNLVVGTTERTTKAYVSESGKTIEALRKINAGGSTYLYYDECGIFEGVKTVDDFEPYNGTTYPITWSEAGEVFGGYVDLEHRKIIIDTIKSGLKNQDWTMNESWGTSNAPMFSFIPSNAKGYANYVKTDSLSDIFKAVTRSELYAESAVDHFSQILSGAMQFRTSANITTIEDFKDYVDGHYIVYKIVTPIEYDLDEPVPTIKTLLGNNNLWADSGQIADVVYVRDLNTYLKSLDDRITALENA